MSLNNLRPPKGAKHPRKRVGRGPGSGHGKTASRGTRARSRGRASASSAGSRAARCRSIAACRSAASHNPFRVEYAVVNLDTLAEVFDAGSAVTPELLRERGLVREARAPDQGARPRRDREEADGAARTSSADRRRRRSRPRAAVAEVDRSGSRAIASRHRRTRHEHMDSLKNIFAIPELRKRVLFTFGLLAVYRVGGHIPTPGINTQALSILTEQATEQPVRPVRHVLGTEPVADDGVRARRDAVHQRVDHPAAADGRLAVPRASLEGRRARPPQDHAVHALRHDPAEPRAVARHRVLPREHHAASRAGCRSSTSPAGPSGS